VPFERVTTLAGLIGGILERGAWGDAAPTTASRDYCRPANLDVQATRASENGHSCIASPYFAS